MRPRLNSSDNWLPPRVYPGKSRYEYRPLGRPMSKLCKLPQKGEPATPALKAEVWRLYVEAQSKIESILERYDLARMIKDFHASAQFSERGERTQKDYIRYSKRVGKAWGHMLPSHVEKHHVRAFMDKLGSRGIWVTANRHHSYISVLFGWGAQYNKVKSNPATDVRKFKEDPRDRYIEDWEYDIPLKMARQSPYLYVAPVMELSYLCRLRENEVLKLSEKHLTDEGIISRRGKGSRSEVTRWTPRLRAAVAEAKSLWPNAPAHINRPLVHDRRGNAVPISSFKTAWGRIMTDVMELPEDKRPTDRFHFHDIKAKGITDHKNHEGGHKSKKMEAVYNRKPDEVDSTR